MKEQRFNGYEKFYGYKRGCLICGNDKECNDREVWAKDEYFKALKCTDCGLVTLDPSLDQDGLNQYYNDYIGNRFKQKQKFDDRKIQYRIDKIFIENYINKGKVLDVGCNGGFFLNTLSENFEKFGIEIDPKAVDYANKEFNVNVIEGEIGKDDFEVNSFDLIIFRGVIEHLIDPKLALDRSYQLLKPGGLIYFCATPNLDSFCAEIYREKWNLFHPIEHINIFSVRTLHRLMGVKRFLLVEERYDYLNTPYENQNNDYKKLTDDINLKNSGRWYEVEKSPPFWGNMMSVIYKKRI